jgi:hypothetical protein
MEYEHLPGRLLPDEAFLKSGQILCQLFSLQPNLDTQCPMIYITALAAGGVRVCYKIVISNFHQGLDRRFFIHESALILPNLSLCLSPKDKND